MRVDAISTWTDPVLKSLYIGLLYLLVYKTSDNNLTELSSAKGSHLI